MDLDRRLIGSWVNLIFWDHGIIGGGKKKKKPFLHRASGMIVDIDSHRIILGHWIVVTGEKEVRDHNREESIILVSTIEKWGIAEPIKWHYL